MREYVEWAFSEEARSECRFGEPIAAGDRAVVEYWAVIEAPAGKVETLAGTSLLRFGANGLVAEQHDYWHMEDGRREPPDDFGR